MQAIDRAAITGVKVDFRAGIIPEFDARSPDAGVEARAAVPIEAPLNRRAFVAQREAPDDVVAHEGHVAGEGPG